MVSAIPVQALKASRNSSAACFSDGLTAAPTTMV
jgi:hypothetical protein